MRHHLHTASLIALSLGIATPALAQDSVAIEEVVVTAQKRAENVQDVPIAISAYTETALKERAVTDVSQLSNLAPNVNLDAGTPFSGSTAVLSAYIRGIGSDDFAFNIDPGVGVYLDGVYLARTVGANQDLLDVSRIEVLKGPQGTLFGRNTIGGAISIVTRDPAKEFHAQADVTVGSHELAQARASVDLPLADGLYSSLTFGIKRREGYLKRIPYPDQRALNATSFTAFESADYDSSQREGGDNTWNLRGKVKWDQGGPFKLTATGDYSRTSSSAFPSKVLATPTFVPGNFAGTSNLPGTAFDPTGTTGFLFGGLYNFCIGATQAQIDARNAQALCGARGTNFRPGLLLPSLAGVNVDANPSNNQLPYDERFLLADKDKSYATGNSFSRLTSWGLGLTGEYELNENLTLKSITAYRELHWIAGLDADGSPLNFLQLSFTMNQKQVSQEFQVLGNAFEDKVKYVLGAYYFHEKGDLHDYVTFAEGLLQVDGPNQLDTENYAAFGQIDWRPIELVSFTIGGRYTREKKDFEGGQQDLNGFNYKLFGCADASGTIRPNGTFPLAPVPCQVALGFPDPSNPLRVYVPGMNHKKFNNFSPKLGVQLHPTDDIMVYGSWSKGYKTGGWTTRLSNPLPTAPDFNEEKAESWELGVKSEFLQRRLQVNAAAFTTDYTGIQLNFQQGVSPTIRNAGDARIKGAEVEVVAAPARGFTVNASVGYIDAEYTSVLPGVLAVSGPNVFQAGTFDGADLPKTPKWKLNVSPRYQTELPNGGTMVLLADWTHATSAWNDSQRSYLLKRKASDMVSASATYRSPEGQWELTVGGTNLLDDRYLTTGGTNIAAGVVFGTYNRPREWYSRLSVKF